MEPDHPRARDDNEDPLETPTIRGKAYTRDQLEGFGSIIKIRATQECLGDLLYEPGHGAFNATVGHIPVTREEADAHNRASDEAKLARFDHTCKVGYGQYLYIKREADGTYEVRTWLGTVVGRAAHRTKLILRFERTGRFFEARIRPAKDCLFFKRVS